MNRDVDGLYHVSGLPGIAVFHPRTPPSTDAGVTGAAVWAISGKRLHNHLLPHDGPRVTFYPGAETTAGDLARFFCGTTAGSVVAIETTWWERVRTARLWVYRFSPEGFVCADACAGYFVSRSSMVPLGVSEVRDVPPALLSCDVELRVLPSLWKVRDAIRASTLAFSFIRMRHAQPRVTADELAIQR